MPAAFAYYAAVDDRAALALVDLPVTVGGPPHDPGPSHPGHRAPPATRRFPRPVFTDRVVSGAAGTDSSFVCGDRVDATDVVATERAEMDGVPVWFVATGNPDDPAVQVLDAEDCSVVYPTG